MKGGNLMNNMICDIHAHIVPGVDDGARNLEMSIAMLRRAYEQGVRNIVCTSHSDSDMNKYFQNLKLLRAQVHKENIDIILYPGCEIYCGYDPIENIINGLNQGIIPTINGTKYVLIEFSPYATANLILQDVQNICDAGYIPILAHTERHLGLMMEPKYIPLLQNHGCLFQVNAYSLQDTDDTQIKSFARDLLRRKIVSFIGSDAHRTDHRPYVINNGIDYIHKHCDAEYANDICYRNAQQMLNLN